MSWLCNASYFKWGGVEWFHCQNWFFRSGFKSHTYILKTIFTFNPIRKWQLFCIPLVSCFVVFSQLVWGPLYDDLSCMQVLARNLKTNVVDILCFMYIFIVCSALVFSQPALDSNHWCVICCFGMVSCFLDHVHCLSSLHGSDMSCVILPHSSALSLQILNKAVWTSFGFFPPKVLIFVYECWNLHHILSEKCSSIL
jgi:hypothetical protein